MIQKFSIERTDVQDCLVINVPLFEDVRGSFVEAWNKENFLANGLPTQWPQDNISHSHKNVARGLHIQRQNSQGKLMRCLNGTILDICVDVRLDSPTFGKKVVKQLSGGLAMYVPSGTAHGFIALTDCTVYYKCTTLYDKESDGGINMGDPEIGLAELVAGRIFSDKDRGLPTLREWIEGKNK